MELFFCFILYYLLFEFMNKAAQVIIGVSGGARWAIVFVDIAYCGITIGLLSGKSVPVKLAFLSAGLIVLIRLLIMKVVRHR